MTAAMVSSATRASAAIRRRGLRRRCRDRMATASVSRRAASPLARVSAGESAAKFSRRSPSRSVEVGAAQTAAIRRHGRVTAPARVANSRRCGSWGRSPPRIDAAQVVRVGVLDRRVTARRAQSSSISAAPARFGGRPSAIWPRSLQQRCEIARERRQFELVSRGCRDRAAEQAARRWRSAFSQSACTLRQRDRLIGTTAGCRGCCRRAPAPVPRGVAAAGQRLENRASRSRKSASAATFRRRSRGPRQQDAAVVMRARQFLADTAGVRGIGASGSCNVERALVGVLRASARSLAVRPQHFAEPVVRVGEGRAMLGLRVVCDERLEPLDRRPVLALRLVAASSSSRSMCPSRTWASASSRATPRCRAPAS